MRGYYPFLRLTSDSPPGIDPRSVKLNTEMGFVIDSRALAGRVSEALDQRVDAGAYEVRLRADGKLEWIEHKADQ